MDRPAEDNAFCSSLARVCGLGLCLRSCPGREFIDYVGTELTAQKKTLQQIPIGEVVSLLDIELCRVVRKRTQAQRACLILRDVTNVPPGDSIRR